MTQPIELKFYFGYDNIADEFYHKNFKPFKYPTQFSLPYSGYGYELDPDNNFSYFIESSVWKRSFMPFVGKRVPIANSPLIQQYTIDGQFNTYFVGHKKNPLSLSIITQEEQFKDLNNLNQLKEIFVIRDTDYWTISPVGLVQGWRDRYSMHPYDDDNIKFVFEDDIQLSLIDAFKYGLLSPKILTNDSVLMDMSASFGYEKYSSKAPDKAPDAPNTIVLDENNDPVNLDLTYFGDVSYHALKCAYSIDYKFIIKGKVLERTATYNKEDNSFSYTTDKTSNYEYHSDVQKVSTSEPGYFFGIALDNTANFSIVRRRIPGESNFYDKTIVTVPIEIFIKPELISPLSLSDLQKWDEATTIKTSKPHNLIDGVPIIVRVPGPSARLNTDYKCYVKVIDESTFALYKDSTLLEKFHTIRNSFANEKIPRSYKLENEILYTIDWTRPSDKLLELLDSAGIKLVHKEDQTPLNDYLRDELNKKLNNGKDIQDVILNFLDYGPSVFYNGKYTFINANNYSTLFPPDKPCSTNIRRYIPSFGFNKDASDKAFNKKQKECDSSFSYRTFQIEDVDIIISEPYVSTIQMGLKVFSFYPSLSIEPGCPNVWRYINDD